jgi:predicted nuclease with TOPRIM domain
MTTKSNFNAWAIVAIIGLLGLNAYQWFNNSQLKTQNTQQHTKLDELEKVSAELEQDYNVALENLEELRGDNKELNSLIDAQKLELQSQKAKINDLIWTKRELSKAKDELANLNTLAAQYVEQLNKLKEENSQLAASNTQLSTQNQELTTTVQTVTKEREDLAQARTILASEKENLAKTNSELSTKVDMANAIKINFIEVKGYDVKDDGKLKEKSKAKDIEMLRVCFVTETNMVTPAGNKTFMIRLINPQGETIAVENKGSGVLTNKLDNTQVRYTTSGEIKYENKDTNACIDWTLDEKLTKGNYAVELYNNSFMVGKGQFVLK